MVDVLWQRGEGYAAFRLEGLWNELQRRHSFSLLCAYARSGFRDDPEALHCICAAHTRVEDGSCASGALSFAAVPACPRALASEYARRLAQEVSRRETLERALRKSLRALGGRADALRELALARAGEQQLRSILDALPVLVSYVDVDRRLHFASAAYERWLGRPAADLPGKHVENVLGSSVYAAVRPHLDRAFEGHTVFHRTELPAANAGIRTLEMTQIPRFGHDGRVVGCVGLFVDVTDRER